MSGRLENEKRIIQATNRILIGKPQYLWEWKNSLIASQKTASTTKDYIGKVLRFLESSNYDMSASAALNYFVSIQTKVNKRGETVRTSDSYQQSTWHCLNNFFTFMVKMGYIDQNPMSMIDKPKNRDLARINENRILLTKEDFEAILDAVRNGVGSSKSRKEQTKWRSRDLAIMTLLMVTGMRKSALMAIDLDDINFTNKTLKVIDKGNKLHSYNLSDNVIEVIEDWIADRDDILEERYGWSKAQDIRALFITKYKDRITDIDDLVNKYCEAALSKHISPHKIRAGFTSIMYQETGDIEFCRRAVGHASVGTTQRYIVTDNKERKRASEIMDSLF